MNYLQAVLLGIVQGITEFLPVSSSGHLALAQKLMRDLPSPKEPQMILFDVLVHLGTLAALLVVFAREARRFLGAAWTQLRTPMPLRHRWRRQWALRLIVLTAVACVVTVAVGLPLKHRFEDAFGNVVAVGIFLMITGTLLFTTRFVGTTRRGLRRMGPITAAIVGLAQGLALAPGISRSGATISAGLLCDVRRRWAGEFSFLIFIPAVLGALALQVVDLRKEQIDWGAWIGPALAGAAAAAVVGYVALRLLLAIIRRSRLWMFALYCWPVGAAAVVWGMVGGV